MPGARRSAWTQCGCRRLTAATPKGGYWFVFLYATRIVAGMGVGGEYAAINSAIAEIEEDVAKTKGKLPPVDPAKELEIRPTENIGSLALLRMLFSHYPSPVGAHRRADDHLVVLVQRDLLHLRVVLEYFFHVTQPAGRAEPAAPGTLASRGT